MGSGNEVTEEVELQLNSVGKTVAMTAQNVYTTSWRVVISSPARLAR